MELEAMQHTGNHNCLFFGQWFQAVAWNMPGYGTSAALPEMTFPALAESLERLLGTLPAERFHLVG